MHGPGSIDRPTPLSPRGRASAYAYLVGVAIAALVGCSAGVELSSESGVAAPASAGSGAPEPSASAGGDDAGLGSGGGAGSGGGGGSGALCPATACAFAADGAATQIACGKRAPVTVVIPGARVPTDDVRLAVTDDETLVGVGMGCGTDFFRLVHDAAGAPQGVLSTALDAGRTELATRAGKYPGSSVALVSVTSSAVVAGQILIDNLGNLSLGPTSPLVSLTPNEAVYHHDVAVAAPPDGTIHGVFDDRHFVRNDIDAVWIEQAPTPHLGWNPASTVDAIGRLVTFWSPFMQYGEPVHVVMTVDGATTPLGDPGVLAFRPVGPPSDFLPASAPTTAVVLQDRDSLQVVWPTMNGEGRATIAAPLLQRDCTAPDDAGLYIDEIGCDGQSCDEHGSGVARGAFAAARTSDGVVWVAYVTSTLDVSIRYGGEIQASCEAQREIGTDQSTTTWHLVRVPLDGSAPEERFAEACAEPGVDYTGGDAIQMQAVGSRLAVALRAFDPAHALGLRIRSFDTTTL